MTARERVFWRLVALGLAGAGSLSISREDWPSAAFLYFCALGLLIGEDRR